ncbi:hypothetical protein [Psychrobacter pygoscelis]|uniref:hypothetical protein n=1 Tax=Psychrobacter pygoscelis TaxID=2488563 RepID=UPI00103ADB7B|nr:hypothetical protein [Psychrobacter pygoscelis]
MSKYPEFEQTTKIGGLNCDYIGRQAGIDFYQDGDTDKNILYGVKNSEVILELFADSLSEVGHLVEFSMRMEVSDD